MHEDTGVDLSSDGNKTWGRYFVNLIYTLFPAVRDYHIGQKFGERKVWRIWRILPNHQTLFDEEDVKSKGGSQGLCRNAVDHIKNFDNDDPSHKTLWHLGVIIIKIFNVMNSIPAQPPFDFTYFSSQPFSGLGRNIFYG